MNTEPPLEDGARAATRPKQSGRPVTQRAEPEPARSVRSTPAATSTLVQTYFIIRLDGSEPQPELKAEQVVGADGLQLKQFAKSHELRPLQVFQGQLVLEQLGEAHDLLGAGPVAGVTDLRKAEAPGPK